MSRPGRPSGLISDKVRVRLEKIARWRVGGLGTNEIAKQLKVTTAALTYLCNLAEYRQIFNRVLAETTSAMDKLVVDAATAKLRQEMTNAVPTALNTVVDIVKQRKDLRSALAAAKTVLELDPQRTFVPAKDAEAVQVSRLSETMAKTVQGEIETLQKERPPLVN